MSNRLKLAFFCHLLFSIEPAAFGVTYLVRSEFMSYHAVAVGMPWSQLPPAQQALILALMRLSGGAYVALALAIVVLLLIPFRRGEVWARWTIGVIGSLGSAGALFGTLYVRAHTPSEPPWLVVAGFALLNLIGLALSLERKNAAFAPSSVAPPLHTEGRC